MLEAVPTFERWGWTMPAIDAMDFEEWYEAADIAEALNQRDAKIASQNRGR